VVYLVYDTVVYLVYDTVLYLVYDIVVYLVYDSVSRTITFLCRIAWIKFRKTIFPNG